MSPIDLVRLDAALNALPNRYPGPGGVAGVVIDGKVVAARAWGHSDLMAGTRMTHATRLPICSISKQFTCGVMLSALDAPERLDARVAAYLPHFTQTVPTVRQLAHNQSGLRDYWALTVLQGAMAEQTFSRDDALSLIARMRTGHFAPGTGYSYCNCNFRILSELIEAETGEALDNLYARLIWQPARMKTAVLTADTRTPVDGVTGYEGSDATGFVPANNGVYWIGDAGISAALDDMLAYETWIDAERDDPGGLYNRLSASPSFADGSPARYGFGLAHETVAGLAVTGHGGALRGFRAQRMHAAQARLSVVVMFNHEANAHTAASDLIEAALGHDAPAPATISDSWLGQWICPETGLLARITTDATGTVLRFATGPDRLVPSAEGGLAGPDLTLMHDGARLRMTRQDDNLATVMAPLPPVIVADGDEIAGQYHSDELDAKMAIEAWDGGLHARFTGMLGTGVWERVHPVGPDTWVVATRRSMDAPAPGDWTLQVTRDVAGKVAGLSLGCCLARRIKYVKTVLSGALSSRDGQNPRLLF